MMNPVQVLSKAIDFKSSSYSEGFYKEFVMERVSNILMVPSPSDEVQKVSIDSNPLSCLYIPDISDHMQLYAVKSDLKAFWSISIPSKSVIDFVPTKYTSKYRMLKNRVRTASGVLTNDKYSTINSLSEKRQIDLLEVFPLLVLGIKDPSYSVIRSLLIRSSYIINYIPNPNDEMIKLASDYELSSILHIKGLQEDIRIRVAESGWPNVLFLRNPTIKELRIALNVELFRESNFS